MLYLLVFLYSLYFNYNKEEKELKFTLPYVLMSLFLINWFLTNFSFFGFLYSLWLSAPYSILWFLGSYFVSVSNIRKQNQSKFEEEKKKQQEDKRKIITLANNEFLPWAMSESFNNIGDIYQTLDFNKMGVVLTDNYIEKNRSVNRDDVARSKVKPKGWPKTNPQTSNGTYYYHRTHKLPFRYCLSEGNDLNVLFTGTSYLNAGVTDGFKLHTSKEDEIDKYFNLKNLILNSKFLDYPSFNGKQYSLNDIETLSDKIIKQNKNSVFKYYMELIGEEIPDEVIVSLYNVSYNRLEFSIKLKNVHSWEFEKSFN